MMLIGGCCCKTHVEVLGVDFIVLGEVEVLLGHENTLYDKVSEKSRWCVWL